MDKDGRESGNPAILVPATTVESGEVSCGSVVLLLLWTRNLQQSARSVSSAAVLVCRRRMLTAIDDIPVKGWYGRPKNMKEPNHKIMGGFLCEYDSERQILVAKINTSKY